MRSIFWTVMASVLSLATPALAAVEDRPFPQESALHHKIAPELAGAHFSKLLIDREGVAYVLTDRGVARLFNDTLALDQSFSPLKGTVPLDLALDPEGHLFYLYPGKALSNGRAGKFVQRLPEGAFSRLALAGGGGLLVHSGAKAEFWRGGERLSQFGAEPPLRGVVPIKDQFLAIQGDSVLRITSNSINTLISGLAPTCLEVVGDALLVGTTNGFLRVSLDTGSILRPLQSRLPWPDLRLIRQGINGEIWFGTDRGAFRMGADGAIRFFASRRWLADNSVVDLQVDGEGNALALTRTGLSQIRRDPMTLAQKAAHYDAKIRARHMRYGFCAELSLKTPGDPASATMIDTDNDGTWSSYYMASQAFRHAATGSAKAKANAWETFEALERLETINWLPGFPSRTFERHGFKNSDKERWHPAGDGEWEWKAHTSSDEIAAHAFGCAALYDTAAETPEEKARIAHHIDKILRHILANDLYLKDVDGEPTLWGRWNPEYVNWYPPSVVDRKLNSAELVALLQFGHAITGRPEYKEKIFSLFQDHGYLDNILIPMDTIAQTPGYIHEGADMGSVWNHSDDLLGFVTYWVLHRHALNDDLKAKYAWVIEDHWEIERVERNPLWTMIFAATGLSGWDEADAAWTLREFPLDTADWSVANSFRKDLDFLPANFRHQHMRQLLPPGERRMTRWNSQPFIPDGGNGGRTEYGGDEFLLPYWMGRHLGVIK